MRLWLAYLGEDGWQSRAATLRSLGEPIKRLNEMYELGRIALPEYRERCDEIDRQQSELEVQKAEPLFEREVQTVRTLVDDFGVMPIGERRRLVASIFAEIRAGGRAPRAAAPR